MNRSMFMERLKELLADITEAEREEAVSYYEEYFDDAGAENEADVIVSLGSPEKVAATIKAGLSDHAVEDGEFSEMGYDNGYCMAKDEIAERTAIERIPAKRKGMGAGGWIIILILCVFALPILGPVLLGIGGAILGIIVAVAAVFFAVLISGVAMVIAGIAIFAAAMISIFVKPIVGVALIGAAFLVVGLGLLISAIGFWIVVNVVPPLFRGVIRLIRKPFEKGGVKS